MIGLNYEFLFVDGLCFVDVICKKYWFECCIYIFVKNSLELDELGTTYSSIYLLVA